MFSALLAASAADITIGADVAMRSDDVNDVIVRALTDKGAAWVEYVKGGSVGDFKP